MAATGSLCSGCGARLTGPCVYPNPFTDRPLSPDGGCITLPGVNVIGPAGEECELGLCADLRLGCGLTPSCDDEGNVTITPNLAGGCNLDVTCDPGTGALDLAVCAQSLTLFDSGVNVVVNNTGTFIATFVPVSTVLRDCQSTDPACVAAASDSGGIRVAFDGIYTVDTYSSIPSIEDAGPATLNRYRHRLAVNGAVSGQGWPGTSMNLTTDCAPCALDGGVGNTSETLCLTAGDLLQIQVATDSVAVEPITVTSAGLSVTYHGKACG